MKSKLKVGQRFEAIVLEGETLEVVEGGLLKIVNPKKGKYVPKEGELYWFIDSYGYICSEFEYDEWFIKHKTVFRTREEVQQYKRYLDVLDKYKYEFSKEEWKNKNIEKWYLSFMSEYSGAFDCCPTYTRKHPNCVYFKSEEDAEDFIEEAGKDNIKKFMFDIWE